MRFVDGDTTHEEDHAVLKCAKTNHENAYKLVLGFAIARYTDEFLSGLNDRDKACQIRSTLFEIISEIKQLQRKGCAFKCLNESVVTQYSFFRFGNR